MGAEAYVALGSNVGDPEANLRVALARLSEHATVAAVSSVYRTEPVGLREQAWFLNAVACLRTAVGPVDLLTAMRGIEASLGRQRVVPLGPRTVDLDLLLYGDLQVDEPGLQLPHPRMRGRRFVLAPLAEIAPALRIGPEGFTVAELLGALPPAGAVERLALPGWPPRAEGSRGP